MRPAARFTPTPDIDDGWRDLISSAPPPAPPPPREAFERGPVSSAPVAERVHVPDGVRTNRDGCVAHVKFSADPSGEQPAFDASDRRMWRVAGGLMGLATLVLLVLGILTFKPQGAPPASPSLAQGQPAGRTAAKSEPAPAAAAVGTARPLIAQHALRHSIAKHAHKHKKIAAR